MADRYPLIVNTGAAQIQELASGDNLNLTGSNISAVTNITASGRVTVNSGANVTAIANGATSGVGNIGASGAVFGLLLAFGMLFPEQMIYIYFAIPIKAKYFVILYGLIELFTGIYNSSADNVAHFAHLGGMLFGFILIKFWRKKGYN